MGSGGKTKTCSTMPESALGGPVNCIISYTPSLQLLLVSLGRKQVQVLPRTPCSLLISFLQFSEKDSDTSTQMRANMLISEIPYILP